MPYRTGAQSQFPCQARMGNIYDWGHSSSNVAWKWQRSRIFCVGCPSAEGLRQYQDWWGTCQRRLLLNGPLTITMACYRKSILCWGKSHLVINRRYFNGVLARRSAHPSPLSAHRGFLGNEHFKKANEWLKEQYGEGEEINWAALGKSS